MKEDIEGLIKLQEVDVVLSKYQERNQEIPVLINELNKNINGAIKKLEEIKIETKEAQLKRKELEIELASIEEEIKKHEGELNAVKTNEAYTALMKEISDEKNQKDDIESKILEIMDSIESIHKKIEEHNKIVDDSKSKIEQDKSVLQKEQEEILAELSKQEEARKKIEKNVSSKILSLYNKINTSRKGTAVAEVVEGCCSGCNLTLTPQVIDDVIKAKNIVLCGNCSRILYVQEKNVESLKNTPTFKHDHTNDKD